MNERPDEIDDSEAERAYAYVLGQYLGDGCVSEQRRKVFRLRITCSEDWPLVIERLRDALRVLMPHNTVGLQSRRGQGCVEVGMSSKRWPALLPQMGPGRKHHRRLSLLPWQQELVYCHAVGDFICGLLHSDGCRIANRVLVRGKTYEYPRYFFSNRSEDIHNMFCVAAAAMGITTTRSGWQQSVARKQDVWLLDAVGGQKASPWPIVPGAGIEPARS